MSESENTLQPVSPPSISTKMSVVDMPIENVKPYENNPRKNDGAVDAVAASIKEFGWRVPIVVDEANVILCGHARLKAAQKVGLSTVPVHVAAGLSEEQKRAYRLADNKLHELSGWDFGVLDLELGGLLGFDMSRFGFECAKIGDIDVDSFFADIEDKAKAPKTITCPKCGTVIER